MSIDTIEVDKTNDDKTHCSTCVFCSTDEYGHSCNIPKLSKFATIEERHLKENTTPQNKQIQFIHIKLRECGYFNTEDSIIKFLPFIV